jgi:molybdopterin synthase catalytic subunit
MAHDPFIKITEGPIDEAEVLGYVRAPEAGGIDLFIGTTRDNANGKDVRWLEYTAYEPMALKMMQQIAVDAAKKWQLTKIAIVHRTGRVDIGEASVVLAVSAPHRKEAFEACRYAIDTLKKEVPIWKKEFFKDGSVWVDGAIGRP